MKKIKIKSLLVIAVVSVISFFLNPLDLDISQKIILSTLLFSVACWATAAIHKSIVCIILFAVYIIFGKSSIVDLTRMAWSDTFFLIVTTTMLSVGMMKTGIIHEYVEKFFRKTSKNIFLLMSVPYFFGIILIFLIPQAFARVIIIGAIFNHLLSAETEEEKRAKQALIFNGFIGITMTYMLFSTGDIVLNQMAIKFSGEAVQKTLTFGHWFQMMSVPTVLASIIVFFLTYLIFKNDFKHFHAGMIGNKSFEKKELTKNQQRISVITMGIILLLWTTQGLHPISPWIVALAGVIVLYAIKILEPSDIKNINLHFLLFILTVFNIGKVLGQSGITAVLFSTLKTLIPASNSSWYLLLIALVIMILHMCIGSSVATMSVVLPIIMPLLIDMGYEAQIVTLMTYIIVNIHFLLPFHQATVMIGTAKEYYPEKYMLRFGIPMTLVTFILLQFLYFPWWNFVL